MNDYDKLIAYYRQCFNLIDCFHFNSEIASKVYSDYITPKNSKVIPITHAGIKDHRVKRALMIKSCASDLLEILPLIKDSQSCYKF